MCARVLAQDFRCRLVEGLLRDSSRCHRGPLATDDQLKGSAADFYARMRTRRTVRDFSSRLVPREAIENCIRAAGTSPTGANMQPWHFAAISDPAAKSEIQSAAEKEEEEFYEHRVPAEWLGALAALGTDARKPFSRGSSVAHRDLHQALIG